VQAFLAPVELPVEAAESVDTAITPLDIEAPDGAGEPPLVLDGPPEVDDSLLSGPPLDVEPPPESIGEDDAPKAAKELIVFLEPDDGTEPIRFLDGPPRIAEELPIEFIPDDPGLEPQTMVPDYAPKFLLPFPVDGDWIMPAEIDWMAELAFADDEPLTADVWLAGAAADPIAQAGEAPIALPLEITAAGSLTDILADCDIMPIPENQGPDAQDDSIETTQGTAVDGTVASNDSDPDGDDLTFFVEDGPVDGSLEFYLDGTYTYTPDPGFSGQDTFTYEASDGNGGTDIATVTITVDAVEVCMMTPINLGPDAQDDTNTTQQDTAVDGTVATNDSDPDGDSLMFFVEDGPVDGSIEFYQDGTYTYTPDPGFSGQDTFTYEASDGNGGTDIATVTITIDAAPNNAPVAVKDYNAMTTCDITVTGNVLDNDSDADCDGLTATLVSGPASGTATLEADGAYTYTPNPGFIGHDVFVYEISDGNGGTSISDVCIDVTPPDNLAPDAVDDTMQTGFNTTVTGDVLINDTDAEGDTLIASLVNGPANGTVTLETDGTYTYTPNAEFSGTDTFTYEISDQQCGTDTACVTIDVAPQPNECPEAVNDDFATCEDETLTGNVLINDGDVDGDTLTASPLTDVLTSEGGLVTLHQDGSFIYMPASGFSGVDTLTYSMSDGNGGTATATVSITVHDIADPQDDLFSGDEGTSIAGDVILNDGTVTAGSSVVVVDGPANGTLTLNTDGTFNYLPNDGFCGEDSFSYAINGPCQPSETANVRLVVSEIVWNTTIVSAGNNGQVWGDPHFEGDDGGLYDVQGEAGHIYNLLSDYGLQVNALFVPWEGHAGSTMVGAIGVRIGNDLIQANLSGTDVNGVELQAGGSRVIGATTVEFDGEYTTVTTAEYKLEFRRREGWMNMKLDAIDPFADNIAPHGLWGLTVDGDADPRNGDYFKDNWNYALQGGGALDTVDEDGNLVVSQRGDDSAYKLYEVANLYSTEALNIAGDPFFRFDAAEGTGLERV
jgi:VCBS repeat-containing protein